MSVFFLILPRWQSLIKLQGSFSGSEARSRSKKNFPAGWTIGPAVTNNFKWPFATIGFILSVLSWCGTLLLIKQANSKKKHVRN